MCLFESTLFKQVLYHPEESQLLTTGSDRKVYIYYDQDIIIILIDQITYWATFDGQAIRFLEGSDEAEINTLAITR